MKEIKKIIFFASFSTTCLVVLFIFDSFKYSDGRLHVVICDVGQGDAIYIRTPKGTDILVDGGYGDKVLNCLSDHMPFWDRSLEAVFLTHPHSDHLNGLISVLRRYKVMHYYTVNGKKETNLEKLEDSILAEKNLTAKLLNVGDYIETKDQVKLLTLWPYKDFTENSGDLDKNGMSLIQLLSFGNFKVLLTGDAEEPAGSNVASKIGDIDVLKVPHHGSYNALSQKFLDQTMPDLAVISVGKDNKYGLPHMQTIDFLKEKGIKILRTDLNGEIEIISDGINFSVDSN